VVYRSKKRDAPRVIQPVPWPPVPRPVPRPGTLNYARDSAPFGRIVEHGRNHNRKYLRKEFGVEFRALRVALDDLYARATEHLPLLQTEPYLRPAESWRVVAPCFHLSLTSLYVAVSLTEDGLHGFAFAHIRHAFEALVIAKYCAVNPESDVFDRWVDGMDLYFSNSVLKKVKAPDPSEIRVLWKTLCEKSHATIWSGQEDLAIDARLPDIGFNLAVVGILVRWTSHLYSGHFVTPSMVYYGKRFRRTKRSELAAKRLRSFFVRQHRSLTVEGRKLVSEYVLKWQLA
jgi:hypothetical protein